MASAQSQLQDNLVDRVSRAVGVRMPDGYEAKVKEFVTKSKVLEGNGGEFTEKWIAGQMKTSWGIDRGNQLLFIWDAVYEQLKGKDKHIYTGEDGNEQRLDDLDKVMYKTEACGLKYTVECFISPGLQDLDTLIGELESINPALTQETNSYKKKKEEYAIREKSIKSKLPNYEQLGTMDMISLKKEVQSLNSVINYLISTVAKQISAEAKQQSISQTYRGLKQCITYYQLCKNNPTLVKPNELAETKEYAKYVTQNCKKYNIDYKAELRKELGDDKKVAELLKFYGVE